MEQKTIELNAFIPKVEQIANKYLKIIILYISTVIQCCTVILLSNSPR